MMAFLLIVIFITAALSLLSYVYCWNDIKGGRPHIISLRQITNVMDRDEINRMFGEPEPGYFYPLAPSQITKLLAARRWYYWCECAADSACLLGAWYFYMSGQDGTDVWIFLGLASLCQGINLAWSAWLIRKWRHQIREEIENSVD